MFRWLIAILLVVLLVGFLPVMPYNSRRTWGWWPSGIFAILFFIFILALLRGAF
jgi:hypothetical protein